MAREFKLQDPGEGLHEAEILQVHISEGDSVADGDTLFTIETDKAATEIPAPFTGTVESLRVAEGDTVEVGEVLLTYSQEGKAEEEPQGEKGSKVEREPEGKERREPEGKQRSDRARESEGAKGEKPEEEQQEEQRSPEAAKSRPEGKAKAPKEGPIPASPATRRLARELGVDLGTVEPGGPEGRVTAEDVRQAAGRKEATGAQEKAPAEQPAAASELP
ncbi:MAG: biotin/lipoyl-containing protein, partial [Candidatus Competibacteraceae bacterium]|nr:biotin/lipoyl-containing protein [Candidatus Competibacteraceae bacterium]